MERLREILRQDVRWGRMAWMALVASLLAVFAFLGAVSLENQVLFFLALLIYSGGGFLIGRSITEHPFWNAIFYTLFCILFTIGFILLYSLGTVGAVTVEVFWMVGWLSLFFILPQSLMGTWMAVTFRRVREARQGDDDDR